MKIWRSVMAACAVMVVSVSAFAQDAPKTVLVRGEHLATAKRQFAAGDPSMKASVDLLVVQAKKALAAPLVSVMDKKNTPSSGDKHDYVSMAPYWWPDPTKPNGLPFIRKDGEIYPESRTDHDGLRLQQTIERVKTLAYAWYFTGDATYAEGAAKRLRGFFLDPATRMNPNLNFGQAVLGVTEGRGTGLIDTRTLPDLVDAVRVLAGSPAWTAADEAGMTAWCRAFLTWMLESKNGKEERDAPNNHGVFYDAQVAALALFVDDAPVARRALDSSIKQRIDAQIAADGKQPLELERTRPLHYSLFILDAYTMLAEMARHMNVDLWHYTSPKGGSLEKALRFVAPYADPKAVFPMKEVSPVGSEIFVLPLRRAVAAFGASAFGRDLNRLPAGVLKNDLSRFEFPEPRAK